MEQVKRFNNAVQVYTTPTDVPVMQRCLAYQFTNLGDTIAFVNGMIIHPSPTPLTALGDSRRVSCHEGYEYSGNIIIAFQSPLGATPKVEIVQLVQVTVSVKERANTL